MTMLRGSKAAVIVGALSASVRTLAGECRDFLELATRSSFQSVLVDRAPVRPVSVAFGPDALLHLEAVERNTLETSGVAVMRIAAAIRAAQATVACRWH